MKSIIIVDEDVKFAAALGHALAVTGRVTTVTSVMEAIKLMSASRFDLVLCEIHLRPASGLDLLEWVKRIRPTKVILMTRASDPLHVDEARAWGVDGVLTKPFDPADIPRMIDDVLKGPSS